MDCSAHDRRSCAGLGWYRYQRGREGKLCIFCFSFSLEGVLRSLPALVSLVSLISFIPLSSLSFSYSNPFFAALQQQKLAATVRGGGGKIYKSDNNDPTGDNNWAAVNSAGALGWTAIGMNGAGTKLAAINPGQGFIYTSSVSFTFLFCDESLKRTKEGENSLTLPSFQISFLPPTLKFSIFCQSSNRTEEPPGRF